MELSKKKCAYCKRKIEKGDELFKNMKNLRFVVARKKAFCCLEHMKSYEKSLLKKCYDGRRCCG